MTGKDKQVAGWRHCYPSLVSFCSGKLWTEWEGQWYYYSAGSLDMCESCNPKFDFPDTVIKVEVHEFSVWTTYQFFYRTTSSKQYSSHTAENKISRWADLLTINCRACQDISTKFYGLPIFLVKMSTASKSTHRRFLLPAQITKISFQAKFQGFYLVSILTILVTTTLMTTQRRVQIWTLCEIEMCTTAPKISVLYFEIVFWVLTNNAWEPQKAAYSHRLEINMPT